MQLLMNYQIADYAGFKAAFDADAEDRGNAGLSLLQLWRENDRSAWALFSVSDAKRANDYLNGPAGVFNAQAGVRSATLHFVETA
ncbi:MAG: hypothetical protein Q4G24_08595 [Paracoccus sp. (in: a-proteobacteria)]|uniref:hypothetical protein n=1 Tax=Paracoccus sp. TaxID=267 RepID=UPI0026E08B9C|nr:hypothetical protein [Paracoccus sp. (in: a-proteobacteria)]MDO5621512.1 hypothetical protein [Paracoccus sp. (in: a-proteobacteria)]